MIQYACIPIALGPFHTIIFDHTYRDKLCDQKVISVYQVGVRICFI